MITNEKVTEVVVFMMLTWSLRTLMDGVMWNIYMLRQDGPSSSNDACLMLV